MTARGIYPTEYTQPYTPTRLKIISLPWVSPSASVARKMKRVDSTIYPPKRKKRCRLSLSQRKKCLIRTITRRL